MLSPSMIHRNDDFVGMEIPIVRLRSLIFNCVHTDNPSRRRAPDGLACSCQLRRSHVQPSIARLVRMQVPEEGFEPPTKGL